MNCKTDMQNGVPHILLACVPFCTIIGVCYAVLSGGLTLGDLPSATSSLFRY
ncbi:hypothetical protein [Komagataeibacter oboediens]|uniref:Uncharacterized protein n=1 Tax=Komagataeibacter oboediens TaxID=65958 RepID=A0ABS5SLI4_9PROT|nr:hypothetical protein [Komagataeibacter oboediens]MBL7234363.1 hypothetical protein [Komagataeibacter oboediens]MBT0675122.1 hypothetical protein [Komagataeibacter oboediens]MBT0678733.1 hypothetical protein [Komagataeibacter oboediens]MBV0886982.1 hypothetical protein [Komagataeibacter oboediens]MBV1823102.1 hypothetical protein [Komagataeibacter oboediens]